MIKVSKFKAYDSQDGGYFTFAPCVYQMNREAFSFGLEIFGRRFFYTDIRFNKPDPEDTTLKEWLKYFGIAALLMVGLTVLASYILPTPKDLESGARYIIEQGGIF
jgi:hypothetical protein